MNRQYTQLAKRRVELVYDGGCVFIHGSKVAETLADVIMRLPSGEELTCNLHLENLIQDLGELQVGDLQKVLGDAHDKPAAAKTFARALLAGLHPFAAVRVVQFGVNTGNGYVCPRCGDIHSLEVTYTSYCALVQTDDGSLEGTDDSRLNGDREWNSESYTQCTNCNCAGSLADFDASMPDVLLKRLLGKQQQGKGFLAGKAWTPANV